MGGSVNALGSEVSFVINFCLFLQIWLTVNYIYDKLFIVFTLFELIFVS